jgi:alkylhydroperoxidase family enzyme
MLPNTPFNRVARQAMAAHHQSSWDRSLELHGDTTFVEVMANAPHAYDWYAGDFYQKLFYSGRVDRKIVELVRFKLANVHGCASCNRGDRLASLEAGFSAEQLDCIDDFENGPFAESEKVALALAEVMVLTNPLGTVTPALYTRARRVFSDAELVELGLIMAVLVGVAKFVFAYDLLEKESFCPFIPNAE